MSTSTNVRSAFFAAPSSEFSVHGHPITRNADGTATIVGVEIFKVGTFRDSMGEQNTWTDFHLAQMVANFELLQAAGTFSSPPVRRDHSISIDKVAGYIEKLYVVGDRLVSDFRITEPDQVDKVARGTYRFVSLEVGMYVTNDETAYWPTVMGVAYVDIPAVEGLHDKDRTIKVFSRTQPHTEPGENPVSGTNDDRGAQRPATFSVRGVETSDHAAVQAYIAELEARPPAAFRVNGAETSDHAAVQAHIESLESFMNDQRDATRKNFVAQLAKDDKITEPQVEALQALVLSFSQEQYDAWTKTYENAPKLGLLANHGRGSNEDGQNPPGSTATPEAATLKAQLQMHRDAGMSDDEIKNTRAYKRLAEIGTAA